MRMVLTFCLNQPKGFMLPPRRTGSENAADGPEDPGLPLVLQAVRSDAGAGPSDMNRKGNRPLAAQGSGKRVQHSPDGPQKPADPGHMRRIRDRYSCRGPGHSPMSCMPFCPPKARPDAGSGYRARCCSDAPVPIRGQRCAGPRQLRVRPASRSSTRPGTDGAVCDLLCDKDPTSPGQSDRSGKPIHHPGRAAFV